MIKQKYAIITISFVVIFILLPVIFYGVHKQKITAKENEKFTQNIKEKIKEELKDNPDLGSSSNPYEYTDFDYYKELVGRGIEVVPNLYDEIKNSDESGLPEYICAIAIEEILNMDLRGGSYGWGTSKEFIEEYDKTVSKRKETVENILNQTDDIDNICKYLDNYGYLAVATLKEISNRDDSADVKEKASSAYKKMMKDKNYSREEVEKYCNILFCNDHN